MASMLSPAMSDQDLLGAMVTHYEPRIETFLISANVKSTQEALAGLTKLQSLEKWKEQNRTTRRDFEYEDQTRKTLRGPPNGGSGNRRPNRSVQVRHIRRDNRDRNLRGNPLRDSRIRQGRRISFGGQGRPDNNTDSRLSAAAHDFMPGSTLRRNDSQIQKMTHDGGRIGDLNA